MPTRYDNLFKEIELLKLKVDALEFKLEHINDKPRRRPKRRTYDTWVSVHTLARSGMSKKNICAMLGIAYTTYQAYHRMTEEEAKLLPTAKSLEEHRKNIRFKLELNRK